VKNSCYGQEVLDKTLVDGKRFLPADFRNLENCVLLITQLKGSP
jgi:hypothetical protein